MLISNTLFRLGGAAILLSNKWWHRPWAKYLLKHGKELIFLTYNLKSSEFIKEPMTQLTELYIKTKMKRDAKESGYP